jgi:hypothetical protein
VAFSEDILFYTEASSTDGISPRLSMPPRMAHTASCTYHDAAPVYRVCHSWHTRQDRGQRVLSALSIWQSLPACHARRSKRDGKSSHDCLLLMMATRHCLLGSIVSPLPVFPVGAGDLCLRNGCAGLSLCVGDRLVITMVSRFLAVTKRLMHASANSVPVTKVLAIFPIIPVKRRLRDIELPATCVMTPERNGFS